MTCMYLPRRRWEQSSVETKQECDNDETIDDEKTMANPAHKWKINCNLKR